jgi:hypothetical protein
MCRHVVRLWGCGHPCPTSPSLFDCSDKEGPKLYIQARVWANQHADIPSTHKNTFMLLQSREYAPQNNIDYGNFHNLIG